MTGIPNYLSVICDRTLWANGKRNPKGLLLVLPRFEHHGTKALSRNRSAEAGA